MTNDISSRIPLGFRLSGVHCGIKSRPDREDIALVVADGPSTAAGVYTQNQLAAPAVRFNRQRTPSENIRVVVINSGNANSCTGPRGVRDAEETARRAAVACGVEEGQVLVMSTGIIGVPLDMEKIATGIDAAARRLGRDDAALLAAARGMMTTDTVEKIASRQVSLAGGAVRITGMAKGSGMIGPRMATMLAVLMTDARLSRFDAQQKLRDVVEDTFNSISVEGHASTNDTVLLVANGSAGAAPSSSADWARFTDGLHAVALELARAIPNDGEGASHLIQIDVVGCRSSEDARRIARAIADSPLVKTAIAGADPNWGRIISAAGNAAVPFNPEQVELTLNGTVLFRGGAPAPFQAAAVSSSLRANRNVEITLTLREGKERTRFWTSDMTADYVRINSEYHT
jgi:glutamate N-acetyltransferase/amino-acid N-acetyltransferase